MAEGLSPTEVGKELAEHQKHAAHAEPGRTSRRDRVITIVEAALLAVVALLAAWSGFASAKWSTESRLLLAQASTARSDANRLADQAGLDRDFDSSTFDAWFTAYLLDDEDGQQTAIRRFRPEFEVAFDAWMATDPFNNPAAPPGPTYMEEYHLPELEQAEDRDQQAEELYAEGARAGEEADQYVRITVFLAVVLFLAGISGHFSVRGARYGLVTLAVVMLVFAISLLIAAPKPPG